MPKPRSYAAVGLGTLAVLQLADYLCITFGHHWLSVAQRPFNVLSTVVAFGALAVLWQRLPIRTPVVLMAAGFVGNLLSYYEYGRYVDVIPMYLWYSSFPDIVISGGCIWLIMVILRKQKEPAP